MELQQLSFADIMAKYVETPSLPVISKTGALTYEPSYISYSEVSDTQSSGKKWWLFVIIMIVLGLCAWAIYTQKENIKKWYIENFENQDEQDGLTYKN